MILRSHTRILYALAVVALAGCGGGSSRTPAGLASVASGGTATKATQVIFSIKWPKPNRDIPIKTKSLLIEITDDTNAANTGRFYTSQTITQPATSATFNNVPVGGLTATITALPDPAEDPKLTPLGKASVSFTTQAGKPFNVPFNVPASTFTTIDHLDITATGSFSLLPGSSVTVTATPKTSAANGNNIVLTDASKLTWGFASGADPSIVTLSSTTGSTITVTGAKEGTTLLTATDSETGRSAIQLLTVSRNQGYATITFQNVPAANSPQNAPAETGSIRVDIQDASKTTVYSTTVSKGVSVPTFNVAPNTYTVTASAYPSPNATGNVQATTTVTDFVVPAGTPDAPYARALAFATTITHVQVTPGTATLIPDGTTQITLTATALDAKNNPVVAAVNQLTFLPVTGITFNTPTLTPSGAVTAAITAQSTATSPVTISAAFQEFNSTAIGPASAADQAIVTLVTTGSAIGTIH